MQGRLGGVSTEMEGSGRMPMGCGWGMGECLSSVREALSHISSNIDRNNGLCGGACDPSVKKVETGGSSSRSFILGSRAGLRLA